MLSSAGPGALSCFPSDDYFVCRIRCLCAVYGRRDGFFLWADGAFTAVCLFDGVFTVFTSDGTDHEELRSFLSFFGAGRLLCSAEAARALGYEASDSGVVMRCVEGPVRDDAREFERPRTKSDYRAVYELTGQSGDLDIWFADIASRVNRGSADLRVVRENGEIVSTACLLFSFDGIGVLGAVATAPAHRGRGHASAVVSSLTRKGVFLLCADALVSFYECLGYAVTDNWCEVDLNE